MFSQAAACQHLLRHLLRHRRQYLRHPMQRSAKPSPSICRDVGLHSYSFRMCVGSYRTLADLNPVNETRKAMKLPGLRFCIEDGSPIWPAVASNATSPPPPPPPGAPAPVLADMLSHKSEDRKNSNPTFYEALLRSQFGFESFCLEKNHLRKHRIVGARPVK